MTIIPKMVITIQKDGVLDRIELEAPFNLSGSTDALVSLVRQIMGSGLVSQCESGTMWLTVQGDEEQRLAAALKQERLAEERILARAEEIRKSRLRATLNQS